MGPLEIFLILLVIALLFGARKLPELGKGMGRGIKEFKQEIREPLPPQQATTPLRDVQVPVQDVEATVISDSTRRD